MVGEGDKAPGFALQGDDGKRHTLANFSKKRLVLYFYPKDDTPGCTIEGKGFTKRLAAIRKLGADVVGVSADDFDSHCRFRDKYKLKVLLLSDPKLSTIKAYGAYGDRGIFGMGILRRTFIIEKGVVKKDFGRVSAVGHADAVLEFLKQ